MKRTCRIAHILPWPAVGGTEHATLRVATAVEGSDFHSLMYCRSDAPAVQDFFNAHGFEVALFDAVEPSYRHPSAFLRASRALIRDLHARRIDLVHCADVLAAHYTALPARLAGCRLACHVRNRLEDVPWRDRTFLGPVQRFAFVSLATWRQFGYQVPPRRGVVLYDGLDLPPAVGSDEVSEVRRRWGVPAGVRLVGMAARVAPQKDFRTLIQAAAQVLPAYPQTRFVVAGDNDRLAVHREHFVQVRQWLAEYRLEPFFVFPGQQDDIGPFLAALDVFVLSTHWEGLPLVILEAMSRGLPVVATAVDGVPEIVLDGQTGLLFPHEDSSCLARQLLRLLSDPPAAAAMGAAGRQFVAARFGRAEFAANLRRLYTGLLEARAGI